MNTTTGAQRYNKRMDKIMDKWRKDKPYWDEYEKRVEALEAQGMNRSDAQGIIDVEFPKGVK